MKANTNAASDTLFSIVTIGGLLADADSNPLQIGVTQQDVYNGYGLSYGIARGSTELLAGVATGGLSTAGKVGKVVAIADALGNGYTVGQGLSDIRQNGFNWQNGTQTALGALGIAGNVAGARQAISKLDDLPTVKGSTGASFGRPKTGTPGICFLAGTPVLQHASDTLTVDTAFAGIDNGPDGESNWYHALGATTIALVGWGISNMQPQSKRCRKKKKAMLEGHEELSADARFEEEVWGGFDGATEEREVHDCSIAQALACSRATKECNAQPDEPQAVIASSQATTSQCEAARSPARCGSTWSRRKKVGAAWLACWLAVAGALFGFGLNGSDNAPISPATQVSYSQTPAATAIELLEPGRKVMGDRSAGEMAGETQIDPKTWRLLSLRTETVWADGTIDDVNVETIQPPQWIAQHNAHVGATVPIPLELVEMGLPEEMTATVVANEPCPEIEAGPGRVVLTTVNHLNNDVWELTVASLDGRVETVRTTGLHKFYRPVDNAWVSTQDLRLGDELEGASGPIVVRRVAKIPGVHRVYNMTVEGEHVYRVSLLGALVHNNGCAQPLPDPRKRPGYDPGAIQQDHPIARALGGDPNITRDLEAATNLRKGGLEGELRKYQQYLMNQGLSEEKALEVIQAEIESLSRDVIAAPFSKVFPPEFSLDDLDQ